MLAQVTERQLDEAFAEQVRKSKNFLDWLLSKTKFKDLAVELDFS